MTFGRARAPGAYVSVKLLFNWNRTKAAGAASNHTVYSCPLYRGLLGGLLALNPKLKAF